MQIMTGSGERRGYVVTFSFSEKEHMHLATPRNASILVQNGGMLARLSDVIAIAGGAFIAAHAQGIVDGAGYDSALVAFAMLMALILFPSWGMYQVSRRHLFLRCVCLPIVAWALALVAAYSLIVILHRAYRPDVSWLRIWACVSADQANVTAADDSDFHGSSNLRKIGGIFDRASQHPAPILGRQYAVPRK